MAASHNSQASKNIITALDKVSKMKEKGQYDAVAQARLLEFMNNQEFVQIMLEEERWMELTDTLDELTTSSVPNVKDQSQVMLLRVCAIRTQEIDSLKKRLSALEEKLVSNGSNAN